MIKKFIGKPCISDTAQSVLESEDVINECVPVLGVLNLDVNGFSEELIVYIIKENFTQRIASTLQMSEKFVSPCN